MKLQAKNYGYKTIPVKAATYELLRSCGTIGDTYDSLISKLVKNASVTKESKE